jgi:hypothetical protein
VLDVLLDVLMDTTYRVDILTLDGEDLHPLPLSLRKTIWRGYSRDSHF